MGGGGGASTFVIVAMHLFFLFLRQHFIFGNVAHVEDLAMLYKVYIGNNNNMLITVVIMMMMMMMTGGGEAH